MGPCQVLLVQLITLSRALAMLIFVSIAFLPRASLAALVVYSYALLTDFLDGRIARQLSCTTTGGALLDGFADKFVTVASALYAVAYGLSLFPSSIVLLRDTLVSAIRSAPTDGRPIIPPIRWLGALTGAPIKIVVLLLLIDSARLAAFQPIPLRDLANALYWLSAGVSIVSMVSSVWRFRYSVLSLFQPKPSSSRRSDR